MELPAEAVSAIQASLQLTGNANHHTSVSRRNALLMQLNPRLKPLFTDADFGGGGRCCCLGKALEHWQRNDWMLQQPSKRQFSLARELLRVFRRATPRDTKAAGVATSPAATGEETRDEPQLATKPLRAKRND